MKIIETDWNWTTGLSNRNSTQYIVLHHAEAVNCTAEDIDRWHKEKNWSGIGYHFFINKSGEIYRGRPLWAVGAQVLGKNNISIGICAEGDYEAHDTEMNAAQLHAFKELITYLKTEYYPDAKIVGHKEIGDSNCPGIYFPLDQLEAYPYDTINKEMNAYDIALSELRNRGILSNDNMWEKYSNGLPCCFALKAIDNGTGGEWYSDEDDTSIHWAQPTVISLCGKSVICDKDQWLNNLDQNISKALVLALCDNITGGTLHQYQAEDVEHWGRRCLDSLCDKAIVRTPSAWTPFDDECNVGNFICILLQSLKYGS